MRRSEEFVRKYQGFVYSTAKKWLHSFQVIGSPVEFDDLVQEVWLGLVEASKRFDGERFKNKFLTYAWYNVRSRLTNLLEKERREFGTKVRVGEAFRKGYCRNRGRNGKVEWHEWEGELRVEGGEI